jgi:hypothetical protein
LPELAVHGLVMLLPGDRDGHLSAQHYQTRRRVLDHDALQTIYGIRLHIGGSTHLLCTAGNEQITIA